MYVFIFTLQVDLLHATGISMEPTPQTYFMEEIYDIKSWITPHLNKLHGHRQPHCFKFILNQEEKAVMYFLNWTSDSWCTTEEATIVLKVCITAKNYRISQNIAM